MGSLYVEECGGKCDQNAQWDPIHMAANSNFTKFKQEIELREGGTVGREGGTVRRSLLSCLKMMIFRSENFP